MTCEGYRLPVFSSLDMIFIQFFFTIGSIGLITLPTADSWYRKPSPRLCPVCINIDISPEMAAQSAQQKPSILCHRI